MTTKTSTFSSTTTFINGDNSGSRLLFTISDAACTGGVTAGDVIRYDDVDSVYRKSIANNPTNSEVVGIVESVNIDGSKNVVIYGSINLPSSTIEDVPVGSTGAGGGADVYFLSPSTSGKIRNTAPTELTEIVKPIYQKAPHGNYTGIVTNYIGYRVPSDVTVFNNSNKTTPIGSMIIGLKPSNNYTSTLSSNYTIPNENISLPEDGEFYEKYENNFVKFVKFKWRPIEYPNYPLWNPSTYANLFDQPVYIDTVTDQSIATNVYFDITNNTFRPFNSFYQINKNENSFGSFTVGFVGKVGSLINGVDTEIGIFEIIDVLEEEGTKTPNFSLSNLFNFSDQDLNPLFVFAFNFVEGIKTRNQSNLNSVQNLSVQNLKSNSYSLNNTDLITTISSLESRIATLETEINK